MAGTGSNREGKFKCKVCRMNFESKEELKFHLMEDHSENLADFIITLFEKSLEPGKPRSQIFVSFFFESQQAHIFPYSSPSVQQSFLRLFGPQMHLFLHLYTISYFLLFISYFLIPISYFLFRWNALDEFLGYHPAIPVRHIRALQL